MDCRAPHGSLVFASLLILAMTVVVSQSASAQNPCPPQTVSNISAPQYLRVDIADGTTGELFVTWAPPSGTGPFTYNVCRSTSPTTSSSYQLVNYCSQATFPPGRSQTQPEYDVSAQNDTLVCRDDGGVETGKIPTSFPLTPGTTYYYEVQACKGAGKCGPYNAVYSNPQTPYSFWSNAPVTCNDCGLPSMQGSITGTGIVTIATPGAIPVATATVTPAATFAVLETNGTTPVYEYYGYHNTGTTGTGAPPPRIPVQNKLVIQLPGSGSLCSDAELAWVARNLGFDTICVNYDNTDEQDSVCAASNFSGRNVQSQVANCFTNISQAKLNWTAGPTGNCTSASSSTTACGIDRYNTVEGKTGKYYYVGSPYDSVEYRISTMLYWLWCNGKDTRNAVTTYWETYLSDNGFPIPAGSTCPVGQPYSTAYTPNWSSITLGGWSQGGDMSTFADYYYANLPYPAYVDRVIDLSAPASAAAVSTTMVAAGYLNTPPTNGLNNIYGLVSANDYIHYCLEKKNAGGVDFSASVYASIWNAIGFAGTIGNDAEEQDINYNPSNPQPCTPLTAPSTKTLEYGAPTNPFPFNSQSSLGRTASHYFVNWAPVNQPGARKDLSSAGHADPLFNWNEDIYEFMLLNTNR